MSQTITLDGFEHYIVQAEHAPSIYGYIIVAYVGLAIFLFGPLICRSVKDKRLDDDINTTLNGNPLEQEMVELGHSGTPEESPANLASLQYGAPLQPLGPTDPHPPPGLHIEHRQEERVPSELSAGSAVSARTRSQKRQSSEGGGLWASPLMDLQQSPAEDLLGGPPAGMPTPRIREEAEGRQSSSRQLNLRWNQGRTLRPSESIQRSLRMERQSAIASEEGSHATRRSSRSRGSAISRPGQGNASQSSMSDLASRLMDEELIEGEAEFYRRRYIQRSRRRRRPSDVSLMPGLSPDALSPNDAADAFDPGTAYSPEDFGITNIGNERKTLLDICFGGLLDLAEPDYETKRILSLAVPASLSSIAEPTFRLVLAAIISYFVDTNSMVAYVLVILFVRLTTAEISGAIADTQSNLVQDALSEGGDLAFFQAGQLVQLAIVSQVVIGVPVFLIWVFLMENVVYWLIPWRFIASTASSYTGVIVVDYLFRGATRSFMLPFHLNGQAQFESNIDLGASLLTVLAIAVVASTKQDRMSLKAIGWIQVIIGIAKTIIKITYVSLKGWLAPYRRGLLNGATLVNPKAVLGFLLQSLPLFIGSICELGEWDLLVLAVRHLGGADVAAWAVMGVVWEVFVASTDGLGEASAVRVSFFLSEGMPREAKRLSTKVAFLAAVEGLVLTSAFYVVGPNIVIALTEDSTLQNLLNDMIGFTGLANLAMTMAQIYWSLTGAQGRFGLASATILFCRWFVIGPIAMVSIFVSFFDVDALAGTIAVGYATAAVALCWFVFRTDWELVSRNAQAQNFEDVSEGEESEEEEEEDESESDEDDSSTGF